MARTPQTTTVVRTEQLSPTMVRLVLGGGDLERFEMLPFTDAYVKVLVPGQEQARPRTYTIRSWDTAAKELVLDFVVHGDEGLAGPWARQAKVGDEVTFLGPGGDYAPSTTADWHLLVGDESALPAIAAALEAIPAETRVHAIVEVHDPSEEIPLARDVTWLHRHDSPRGDLAVAAVEQVDEPGEVHAFVHGEAGMVKRIRRILVQDRAVPKSQLSISGYWRLGSDDEGWRAIKRDWNAEIEQEEAQASTS